MRVTLVCPYSLALPGGVQGQVLGLARALQVAGDEVTVVAPGDARAPDPADAWAPGTGADQPGGSTESGGPGPTVVIVGGTSSIPVNGSRAPVALSPATAFRALRAVRVSRPDVVHLHEPLAPIVSLGVLGGLFAGRTFASGGRDVPRGALRGGRRRRPAVLGTFHRAGAGRGYRALGVAARPLLGALGSIVAVSGPALETLRATCGDVAAARADVLFNGIDLARFDVEPWPTDGRPVVCFAGRHEARKGLETLLRAFAEDGDAPESRGRSAGGLGHVQLWVIGDGPETGPLRARYGNDRRITWCGRVGDGELARRLAASSIFVAPALRGESFGIVLLEAMAAGAPVVASDLPGFRAAAGDGAHYVTPGDAEGLRLALVRSLADPDALDARREVGRFRARAYSLDALASAYRDRYLAITAGSR